MGRAEVGSTKYVANKMKSKGLQRLRWWCEPCQKQCRDANGFKCHTQSSSHIRQMEIIGENPREHINRFSKDFQAEFVTLLRTSHNEKFIGANRFYNEFISNKEHTHMNSTRFASLTEFVKYLGREGIVHVKEDEKDGLMIAWRDTSAEAVKRREEIAAMERAEARSGAGEDKMLKKMAKRAQEEAEAKKIIEAKRAAAAQKDYPSPPADEKKSESPPVDGKEGGDAAEGEEQKPAAPPVKISFGLKAKTLPGKGGVGEGKKQSVFKRARAENGDAKPVKKVKL